MKTTDLKQTFIVPGYTRQMYKENNLVVMTVCCEDSEWCMATTRLSSKYNDELIWALKSIGCKVISCTK